MSAISETKAEHYIEAEQALLGTLLMDSSGIDVLDGSVVTDDFSEALHGQLFELMLDARADGRAFNPALFATMLGKAATDKVEGTNKTLGQYLAQLCAMSVGRAYVRDYARVVVENANYRRLAQAGSLLHQRATGGHIVGKPGQIASEIISDLDAIVSSSLSDTVKRMTIGQAAESAMNAMQERRKNGAKIGLPWPLKDMNDATGGMQPGQLIIVAARPSMGKSTLGLSIAGHLAQEGHGVCFISLEMGAESLAERMMSDLSFSSDRPIPYIDLAAGKFEGQDDARVVEAYDRLQRLPLLIEQQGGLSVAQISARARACALRFTNDGLALKCLVVDHLGLVAASSRYAGARHSELGEITSSLKALAKELGIPVVLLSQLNRSVESRDNKRPNLSDLRESGRIEEDADTVVLLYRESYYLERTKENDPQKEVERQHKLLEMENILEINIAKQRQGPTKTVSCFVSMPCNAIRDLDRRYS